MFDGNSGDVSLDIEANYASGMAGSSDGVLWLVDWLDRWESEMGVVLSIKTAQTSNQTRLFFSLGSMRPDSAS